MSTVSWDQAEQCWLLYFPPWPVCINFLCTCNTSYLGQRQGA